MTRKQEQQIKKYTQKSQVQLSSMEPGPLDQDAVATCAAGQVDIHLYDWQLQILSYVAGAFIRFRMLVKSLYRAEVSLSSDCLSIKGGKLPDNELLVEEEFAPLILASVVSFFNSEWKALKD